VHGRYSVLSEDDADHVTRYFGSGDGSTESEHHISGTDHLSSVTVSQLIVRSYQRPSMSLQQHIDELLSTPPSNKGENQQEWLALLNQWEEDQKA
jgi:hypothetical protein